MRITQIDAERESRLYRVAWAEATSAAQIAATLNAR
jgi:hypothetical protein